MKKSAHAHSALTQNRQFRARIARKARGHFNEMGRKRSYTCQIYSQSQTEVEGTKTDSGT